MNKLVSHAKYMVSPLKLILVILLIVKYSVLHTDHTTNALAHADTLSQIIIIYKPKCKYTVWHMQMT